MTDMNRVTDEQKLRGFSVGVPCPMCFSDVEYNGNYFCSICTWVMPDRNVDPWIMVILLDGLRKTYRRHGLVPDHIENYMAGQQGRTKYQR